LVLDIIHALSYLWAAGFALCGKDARHTEIWVIRFLTKLLTCRVENVIANIRRSVAQRGLSAAERKPVAKSLRYFTRHVTMMRYPEFLAQGLPIATGVIEGACRHLVQEPRNHRRPVAVGRRRSGAQAPSNPFHRRLGRLLALPPPSTVTLPEMFGQSSSASPSTATMSLMVVPVRAKRNVKRVQLVESASTLGRVAPAPSVMSKSPRTGSVTRRITRLGSFSLSSSRAPKPTALARIAVVG
jgi:hypothetical protein